MTARIAGAGAALLLAASACVPGAAEAQPFEGIWQSEGFGSYLLISGGDVEVFEHTSISCVKVATSSARGIADVVRLEAGRLVLEDQGRTVRFDPVPLLPEACVADFFESSPRRTVEVLAATLEEHYVPGLDADWGDRLARILAVLAEDATPDQVFAAATGLLAPLADPGVQLVAPGLFDGVWATDPDPTAAAIAARIGSGAGLAPGFEVDGEGGIVIGEAGVAGYLGLTRLARYREDGDEDDDEQVLGFALDRALQLRDPGSGFILDLRAAGGGFEALALLVATRFVPSGTVVATRRARVERTQMRTDAGDVVVRPLPTGVYGGPVVVLIGPGTSGGAELLAQALGDLENVTLVGLSTAGAPGQSLVRVLPHRWTLGIPHQDFLLPDGSILGVNGVTPDVVVEVSISDLEAGKDPQLEAAVGFLSD